MKSNCFFFVGVSLSLAADLLPVGETTALLHLLLTPETLSPQAWDSRADLSVPQVLSHCYMGQITPYTHPE